MSKRILVTGGTGTLGRPLVRRLLTDGHDVRVLSRRQRPLDAPDCAWAVGDLRTGQGLDAALADRDVVVHCAQLLRGDPAATRRVLAGAEQAGVAHLVYIAIVGVENLPPLRHKYTSERLVSAAPVPSTVLRASQFHNLVLRLFTAQRRLPVLLVPARIAIQPVEVGEVAGRLAELAAGNPAGRVDDLAGPDILDLADLAHRYLRRYGLRRLVLPVPVPGRTGRAYRGGAHLAPEHADGRVSFDEFLELSRPSRA